MSKKLFSSCIRGRKISLGRTRFCHNSPLLGSERREIAMTMKDKAESAGDAIKVPAEIHRHRLQFRAKLLENPNYFGNLKASAFDAVSTLTGSVLYEEIGCVGFQPQLNRLEAVVFVNQPSGYGGDICRITPMKSRS